MRRFRGKITYLLILGVLLCAILPACTPKHQDSGLQIITTSFPAYDFARRLTQDCDDVEVRMLLSPGTESHSYDPSAADMMAVHDADLFIYIGQEADVWAEQMIASAGDKLQVFALTDGIELLTDEDHHEADPHVWTSPVNVVTIVERLTSVLCGLSDVTEEDCVKIETASIAYVQELQQLDRDFREFFQGIPEEDRLLVFGDRFPFRYFAKVYGVSYAAAFPGCSHESEPSASTVMALIDTVKSRGISTVFYVEFSEHRIADTIASETGAEIALFHSCHNVTQAEFEQGATYLSLMRGNLERLQESFR